MANHEDVKREQFAGCSPYEARIGFSRAVRVGDHVYVSGTAPIGEDGRTAHRGDPYAQTLRCIEIIEQALGAAGARLKDVVRIRMYLPDVKHSETVSEAYRSVFGEIRPAATMVICRLLEDDWVVEMEADAVVGSGSD